jgi:hypothetical protein
LLAGHTIGAAVAVVVPVEVEVVPVAVLLVPVLPVSSGTSFADQTCPAGPPSFSAPFL